MITKAGKELFLYNKFLRDYAGQRPGNDEIAYSAKDLLGLFHKSELSGAASV
jgi:hypothetical protein